jgi:hypothetical protein
VTLLTACCFATGCRLLLWHNKCLQLLLLLGLRGLRRPGGGLQTLLVATPGLHSSAHACLLVAVRSASDNADVTCAPLLPLPAARERADELCAGAWRANQRCGPVCASSWRLFCPGVPFGAPPSVHIMLHVVNVLHQHCIDTHTHTRHTSADSSVSIMAPASLAEHTSDAVSRVPSCAVTFNIAVLALLHLS